jgi:hypothetical protein
MMERGRLLEENKKLAERIERMEESAASADILRKSLNDEITKRDRELREMDAEAKAHREVMQKKDAEIQEWLMQLANARNERDAAITRAGNIATCRDRWMKIAADCGRMDGEDAGEFIARLAQQSAQGVALAVKVEELRVVNIKQEQELEELRSAKSIAKNGLDESYQVKVLNQLGQTIAYKDRQLMVMVSMYKRIKACRDIEDRSAQMMSITSAIDDAEDALSKLTA